MEWAVLLFTIILSVVAIVTTRWYGKEAGKRLEEMKTILSRMDKGVSEEIKGILEIKRKVKHLAGLSLKHNKSKPKSKHERK